MGEDGRAVAFQMLVEAQAKASFGQHTSKRGLAHFQRITPHVVAIQLDQVESCSHWPLEGSLSVLVGRHGAMNPAGRVCCNMRTEYSWLNHNCNFTRLKFAFLLRSYDRPASRRGPPRPVGGPPLLGGVGGIAAIAAHPFLSWASAKRVHGLRSSQNI